MSAEPLEWLASALIGVLYLCGFIAGCQVLSAWSRGRRWFE